MAFPRASVSAATAATAVLTLAGFAGTARADRVRLESGEVVFGAVDVERSDETTLVVDDFLAGARRAFGWDAVDRADAERLLYASGAGWHAGDVVPGERVVYRVRDGVAEIRGVVERVERGVLYVRSAASTSPVPIARADVVWRDPIELDPTDVGSIDDLFAARRDDLAPRDGENWLRLAAYGERIGAFEASRQAYARAADDAVCPLRAVARAGVTRMTVRVVEQRALLELGDLRADLVARRWQRVRDGIDTFLDRHPDPTDAVRDDLAGLRTDFAARRLAFFAREAGRQFESNARALLDRRVVMPGVGFNDVQAWVRRDLLTEALTELERRFRALDPAVTDEEARAFFDARPRTWQRASYGRASFLVAPAKGVRGPTRDTWWNAAPPEDRARFWWAVFVEKSGLFEVKPVRERVPCIRCDGKGRLAKRLAGGGVLEYVCDRCGGACFDEVVVYR